ncbi:ParA family protein [Riemerella anatipestifer]|nr:ParA family protein [Riemerella anatipestifer]MDY3358744.1 ParA family protein [Riemerella anatipestifer]
MSIILSIITQKGGVGKTTTTIHVGAALAQKKGTNVLLIDFDSQKNLSLGYGIKEDFPYTVKDFLDNTGKFKLKHQGSTNLYIMAGDELLEEEDNYDRFILKRNLYNLLEQMPFDYVLIDCPPRPLMKKITLGEIALCASDYVISPIEAEQYSFAGVDNLIPSFLKIKEKYNPKLNFLGFFFNKVLTNTVNFRNYSGIIKNNEASDYFFKSFIRQDMIVERAKQEGKNIFQINENSRASIDYKGLVREIKSKIRKYEK